jgi:hypothetical protein
MYVCTYCTYMYACMRVYTYTYVCLNAPAQQLAMPCGHPHSWMYVYVCMHACIYVHVCMPKRTCTATCHAVWPSAFVNVVSALFSSRSLTTSMCPRNAAWWSGIRRCCVYVFIYIYIYIYIYICIRIHTTLLCACVCVYIYIYIYIICIRTHTTLLCVYMCICACEDGGFRHAHKDMYVCAHGMLRDGAEYDVSVCIYVVRMVH